MFTEYICESSWENQSRRGWTTLASFVLQTFAVGTVLIIPLLYNAGLPALRFFAPALVVPPSPPPPMAASHGSTTREPVSSLNSAGIPIAPQRIPQSIPIIHDEATQATIPIIGSGVPGGTGTPAGTNAALNAIAGLESGISPPLPSKPVARLPRTSRMMEGLLVHRVQPEYPPLARAARIQGAVVLQAVIAKDGTVEKLRLLSGHPMLAQAAIDAVRQWRYRPYLLNGEPVEVDTQITVNFVLSGG